MGSLHSLRKERDDIRSGRKREEQGAKQCNDETYARTKAYARTVPWVLLSECNYWWTRDSEEEERVTLFASLDMG